MRTFGPRGRTKIPQSVDERMAPIDLLYWAIFACLKSHARDIDPEALLEMGMYIADNKLTIIVPKSCADAALKAAMECYILRMFKGNMDWELVIDDAKFQKLVE